MMENLDLRPNLTTGRAINTAHRALVDKLPLVVTPGLLFRNIDESGEGHVKCHSTTRTKDESSAVNHHYELTVISKREMAYNEPTARGMDSRASQRLLRA